LAGARLIADTIERDLRRLDLALRLRRLRLGGVDLAPKLGDIRPYLIADLIDAETPLADRFLVLANDRI
jgi:hypothetical protein